MTREPSNSRIFNLQVEVDIDKLTDAYTGGEPELATDLISMLEYELEGWLLGVKVKDVTLLNVEEV